MHLKNGTSPVEYDEKKDSASAKAESVSESTSDVDNDLDPVMLDKAFKFAAQSSVALVRPCISLLLLS
jgi:hypothetical protein